MKPGAVPSPESGARLCVEEGLGRARYHEPVRVGVPFPRGLVFDATEIAVLDQQEHAVPHQCRVLACWPDRSVKWMLVDALVCVEANQRALLWVRRKGLHGDSPRVGNTPALNIAQDPERFIVDTGGGQFQVSRRGSGPLQAVLLGSTEVLAPVGSEIRLRMGNGAEHVPFVDSVRLEESGPVRASILVEGGFAHRGRRSPLQFKSRLVFFAGSNCMTLEFQIRNPRAARHPGGLWDLGDGGSCSLADLSVRLHPRNPVREADWYAEVPGPAQRTSRLHFSLYQDSSGGANWDSPNHVDFANRLTVSQPGYQAKAGPPGESKLIAEGRRATPCLRVSTETVWLAATVKDFWQNFPKALRLEDGTLSIGLFPSECAAGFELQAGEQKRHTLFLDFGPHGHEPVIPLMQEPLTASLEPSWIEQCEAISSFAVPGTNDNQSYSKYVGSIVEGPNSFFCKREVVDEYGWRNFGDLYADHEAVHHSGPKPMVSHYNNQYDFIHGAAIQFLRTGDSRWRRLMEDAARHTIDIDIYHTAEDRSAYNGGLFWHTDHYKDAATSSHRSYSRANGGRGYGGGPSNENNYTSGLLHYYYLTGDREAGDAVLELANWVIAMDDGSLNLFGLIDSGPTGLASKTVSTDYHGPGRGAGNSINALLDAYRLCNDRRFVVKAEQLIRRCIHPADNIQALRLDEPEHRWSYLVFLQILGKYLDQKMELGELDYCYHYARASLLRYADWMLDNEVPYKDVLHKVEIPTETWPAQDIRKCHVLYLASKYADPAARDALKRRAAYFFERCIRDLLSFDTAYLTRPMVILCVYGYVHSFFQKQRDPPVLDATHGYDFGEPRVFQPQRDRLKIELRRKLRVASAEIRRMLRAEWSRVLNRIFPTR